MVALFTMTVLLSSACVIAVFDPAQQGQFWPAAAFHRSLDMKPGGDVTLENGDGDVEISGWDEDRIEISAQGSRDVPQSAGIYFIGRKFSPPDVRIQREGHSVRIRTRESGYGEKDKAVNYIIRVPHSIHLDSIRNGRGRMAISDVYGTALLDAEEGEIRVSNYSGNLDIQLGTGTVEAEILDLRPQDSVRIRVERGDIVLFLESEVAAQLIAEAPQGKISSELELDPPLSGRTASVKLRGGGASLELMAVRGDIRIRKVEKTP